MSKRPYNDGDDSPPAKRSRGRFEPSPYSRRDDRDRDGRHDHRDSYSKEKHNRYDDRRGKLEGPHKVNKESHGEDEYPPPLLPSPLPPLPELSAEFAQTPFRHRSSNNSPTQDSYDVFEFKGDADIERAATNIIFYKYRNYLQVGEMSQVREQLVKNETLAEYSRAYHLDKKINVKDMKSMQRDSHGKGNKGLTKIVADVFEAYVCAVILSAPDRHTGEEIVEKWLEALWAPRLERVMKENKVFTSRQNQQSNPAERYDDNAKATLQKRILRSTFVKLEYRKIGTVELKGAKLGQNEWTVDLYLTASEYGIDQKFLARGKGRSLAEAGNWCAVQAMHGDNKKFIDDLEKKVQKAIDDLRRKKLEDAEARMKQASKTEEEEEKAKLAAIKASTAPVHGQPANEVD